MKQNSITLNIGLANGKGTQNSIAATLVAVECSGLRVTACRTVAGLWQGKPETTLALECVSALPLCHAECRAAVTVALVRLARTLGQSCVAVRWPYGRGELLPRVEEFDPACFQAATLTGDMQAANVAQACFHAAGAAEDNAEMMKGGDMRAAANTILRHREQLAATIAPQDDKAGDAACIAGMGREFDGGFREAARSEFIAKYGHAPEAGQSNWPFKTAPEITSGW